MTAIENIKNKINYLYENNPNIHISVVINHPKIEIQNEPAVIKGVYSNIFRIEEYSKGVPQCYTLQYIDIITKRIDITELEV